MALHLFNKFRGKEALSELRFIPALGSSPCLLFTLLGYSYRTTILLDEFTYTNDLESYQSSKFMDYRREIELGVSNDYKQPLG